MRSPHPCKHLGARVALHQCLPCAAKGQQVSVPLHACSVHNHCTLGMILPGIACCEGCLDVAPRWLEPAAGGRRHLLYHCYPRTPVWRWNIDQLKRRMGLFNGRRIVAVVTDEHTNALADVQAALASARVEWVQLPNDPIAREMASHPLLLEALRAHIGAEDVTFYGHAKGISSSVYGPGVQRWADEMYAGNLDYWPAVERELKTHACCGIYRRLLSPAPAAHVAWHYSGSFRWTRNKDLYSRNWRRIDGNWVGPETYPGLHFTLEESACLYGEFSSGGIALYAQAEWDKWAQAAADQWRGAHQVDKTDWTKYDA